ncbi:unnamed protein product, partial [Prorocentrum cordatum]
DRCACCDIQHGAAVSIHRACDRVVQGILLRGLPPEGREADRTLWSRRPCMADASAGDRLCVSPSERSVGQEQVSVGGQRCPDAAAAARLSALRGAQVVCKGTSSRGSAAQSWHLFSEPFPLFLSFSLS